MSHLFTRVPPPKTALGYHRILSPTAGIRVSPLCLGGMSIGSAWSEAMGSMSKEGAFALLDAFYESGGNFIDTASNYQDEESEKWIGEWMESRGVRHQMVIATKFSTNYRSHVMKKETTVDGIPSNYGGNSSKTLYVSLEDSLAKLRTKYIDILYVHWWDYSTSVEELMRALDNVVGSRQVLYLGISDTPAWVVTKANQFARDHALSPFVIYQGRWSIMLRDMEREIIPMCIDQGMAIAPWGAIGMGKFQSKRQMEERKENNESFRKLGTLPSLGGKIIEQTPLEITISEALEKVAHQIDPSGSTSVTAVALAYVLQRSPYVFPIIGGRKISHLKDNIRALEITLSEEQIQFLESQTGFELGFPHDLIGEDPRRKGETTNWPLLRSANIKWVRHPTAIGGTNTVTGL